MNYRDGGDADKDDRDGSDVDADKDDRDGGDVGGILKAMMSSLAGTHRTLGQLSS